MIALTAASACRHPVRSYRLAQAKSRPDLCLGDFTTCTKEQLGPDLLLPPYRPIGEDVTD
jgi:hypothetical protein